MNDSEAFTKAADALAVHWGHFFHECACATLRSNSASSLLTAPGSRGLLKSAARRQRKAVLAGVDVSPNQWRRVDTFRKACAAIAARGGPAAPATFAGHHVEFVLRENGPHVVRFAGTGAAAPGWTAALTGMGLGDGRALEGRSGHGRHLFGVQVVVVCDDKTAAGGLHELVFGVGPWSGRPPPTPRALAAAGLLFALGLVAGYQRRAAGVVTSGAPWWHMHPAFAVVPGADGAGLAFLRGDLPHRWTTLPAGQALVDFLLTNRHAITEWVTRILCGAPADTVAAFSTTVLCNDGRANLFVWRHPLSETERPHWLAKWELPHTTVAKWETERSTHATLVRELGCISSSRQLKRAMRGPAPDLRVPHYSRIL